MCYFFLSRTLSLSLYFSLFPLFFSALVRNPPREFINIQEQRPFLLGISTIVRNDIVSQSKCVFSAAQFPEDFVLLCEFKARFVTMTGKSTLRTKETRCLSASRSAKLLLPWFPLNLLSKPVSFSLSLSLSLSLYCHFLCSSAPLCTSVRSVSTLFVSVHLACADRNTSDKYYTAIRNLHLVI